MTQTNVLIFDLDGTLIHSAPDIHAAVNKALIAAGRRSLDLSQVISFVGNGVEALVSRSLTATGDCDAELHAAVLEQFLRFYEADKTTLTAPYPGVVAALESFKSAGLALGVCTNKPQGPAQEICEQLGLSRFFDVIAGATPQVPKKPDAEPLLRCISDLGGTATRTIYVGDSAVDYRTARNAHVRFRLFSGGYLNDDLPELPAAHRFDHWRDHRILEA
jgi:phosphoglycolate phosphatase